MTDFISGQKSDEPQILLGYSMGARAALLHAVAYPDSWDALILISGTAGIDSETERAERVQQDQMLAERLARKGVPEFLRYWKQTPLIQSQQNIRSDWRESMHTHRLQHTKEGLAASLENFGQGSYPNLWPQLGKLKCPSLLITGETDQKYCMLSKRMEQQLPCAQWFCIPGAGHAPHLEAPEQTVALIENFKSSVFKESK